MSERFRHHNVPIESVLINFYRCARRVRQTICLHFETGHGREKLLDFQLYTVFGVRHVRSSSDSIKPEVGAVVDDDDDDDNNNYPRRHAVRIFQTVRTAERRACPRPVRSRDLLQSLLSYANNVVTRPRSREKFKTLKSEIGGARFGNCARPIRRPNRRRSGRRRLLWVGENTRFASSRFREKDAVYRLLTFSVVSARLVFWSYLFFSAGRRR